MKLIFIRHAEPDYPNNTLTEKGFLEAEALGKKYSAKDFDYIYSSPLNRAKFTCEKVIKGEKEVTTYDWLEEFNPARDNGINFKVNWDVLPRVLNEHQDLYDNDKYLDSEYFKGIEVKKRYKEVTSEFEKLLEKHGYKKEGSYFKVLKRNSDTIAFFCHFGITSVLLSHLINIPYIILAQAFCALPSSVTTVVSEEREDGIAQFRVLKYGDTNHLKEEGLEDSFSGRFVETYTDKGRH